MPGHDKIRSENGEPAGASGNPSMEMEYLQNACSKAPHNTPMDTCTQAADLEESQSKQTQQGDANSDLTKASDSGENLVPATTHTEKVTTIGRWRKWSENKTFNTFLKKAHDSAKRCTYKPEEQFAGAKSESTTKAEMSYCDTARKKTELSNVFREANESFNKAKKETEAPADSRERIEAFNVSKNRMQPHNFAEHAGRKRARDHPQMKTTMKRLPPPPPPPPVRRKEIMRRHPV